MSILKIEIRENHLKLLKHLKWSLNDKKLIVNISDEEDSTIFNENNLYDACDIILNGVPIDFDPFNTSEIKQYSTEEKSEWDKLYSELPLVLSVILQTQSFKIGKYKCKYHDQVWKKVK